MSPVKRILKMAWDSVVAFVTPKIFALLHIPPIVINILGLL
jgi:hypothetical protein